MAVEMTDRLAERGSDDDVALLVRLSTTDAFAHQFGFRRSVILALIRIDSKPAIGALIGLVGKIDGEGQADAIKYLTSVTNQALGNNQAAWAKWWAENSETFVIPPAETRTLAAAETVSPGVTLYYGLPMYATRIVFIMDTSNSMIGFRLEAAKRELCKAIDALRPTDQFTVLVFDRTVRVWQKKPVLADVANKKKAIQFVKKQGTQLMTASFDALEAALDIDAEAIFFLTDGAPYGGKISAAGRDRAGDHGHESLAARIDLHHRHRGRDARQPDGNVSQEPGRRKLRRLPPRRRVAVLCPLDVSRLLNC